MVPWHTPSLFGQPVTFTATVDSGGNGTPTGTVQFFIDGSSSGGLVTLTAGAAVSAPVANLSVGGHSVTATYGGVTRFAGSTAPGVIQNVAMAFTTTHISSSVNGSVFGQPVMFTATTTVIAPGGGTPSGLMAFFLDGQPLATVATSSGSATTPPVPSNLLAPGNHVVTAVFPDTASYHTSSVVLLGGQNVAKADTTTTVTSSVPASVVGQPVTFTATVLPNAPGAGTPTGTVSFYVDGTFSETDSLVGGATATVSTFTLPLGSHPVTATYSGDANFNANTSGTLPQVVGTAGTTTTVVSAKPSTVFGEPVAFTATVLPLLPGAGTPTGTVQFFADNVSFGTVTLTGSSALSPPIGSLSVGPHTVTATYSGDSNFTTSSNSTIQTVTKADVGVTMSAVPSSPVYGAPVIFTATITATAPGAGTPTGTVQFRLAGVRSAPWSPRPGASRRPPSAALRSAHPVITADYNGNASFNTGTGTLLGGLTVQRAGTSVSVTAVPNPSELGHPVIFTATITATPPAPALPAAPPRSSSRTTASTSDRP